MKPSASPFGRGTRVRPLVYGHRGTRRGAPENTLVAMQLALAQGADGIELDVRLCASGEIIVLHDPDLARVAGAPLRAQDATFSQLRAHDLGQGAPVPSLDEAIDLVLGAGKLLNVELKADVPDRSALVTAVNACLAARSPREREHVLLSCFDAGICRELVATTDLTVAYLYERAEDAAIPPGCRAVHPRYTLLDPTITARLRAQDLIVNTWTVNDAQLTRDLASAGLDGIITDDAPLVLAALQNS
jgi:glycerophosphoryl diester phosphodiesterase